jgi:hypothetical protein
VDFEKQGTARGGGLVRDPHGFYSNFMPRKTASGGAATPDGESRLFAGEAPAAAISFGDSAVVSIASDEFGRQPVKMDMRIRIDAVFLRQAFQSEDINNPLIPARIFM